MDPLSSVLSLLKLQGYATSGFDAAGSWAIRFGPHPGIKFHAVLAGACWIAVGDDAPVEVRRGECFLLARGKPFFIASDLSAEPINGDALVRQAAGGRTLTHNGGGAFLIVGAFFSVAASQADMLLDMLPPLIHLREEADQETLRWLIERTRRELREPQPGGFMVARQIATMMLVQVLRLHLANEGAKRDGKQVGWLFALADRRIRSALDALHGHPGHRWTLAEMAREAAMSRTSFALRFKRTVGLSPADYLTRWRMRLAADRLTGTREPLPEIALALGYRSEKAFSTAFRRVMDCSPARRASMAGDRLRVGSTGMSAASPRSFSNCRQAAQRSRTARIIPTEGAWPDGEAIKARLRPWRRSASANA